MASKRQRDRKHRQRQHAARRTVIPLFAHLTDIIEGRRSLPESEAKFQHYVPQLHLRGFSANPRPVRNALIWRLDKESGSVDQKRVARVGGEPRFNRVKGVDEKYTNAVEAWLGIVEQYAAPALDRLISTSSRPSKADRITIAFYLALQAGRTPLGLQRIQQIGDSIVNAQLTLATQEKDRFAQIGRIAGVGEPGEEIDDLRKRIREAEGIKMKDPRSEAIRGAIRTAGELTNIIGPMTWTLLISAEPLVIGDHPITHHDPRPPLYPWTEPTWKSSTTAEGYIELTTRVALRMTHRQSLNEPDFAVQELSASGAAELNLRSYGWASQHVFAEDRDTLEHLHAKAESDPAAVPRASQRYHVVTASEQAFRPNEPNEQPDGWPSHVQRRGANSEIELCRYRVVRTDCPHEMQDAVDWALRAERRLHPVGARFDTIARARPV